MIPGSYQFTLDRMVGLSYGDVQYVGKQMLSVITPDDDARFGAALRTVIKVV